MMEEAPYWMWMKRKQVLQSHSPVPSNNSWEEKAFAEDAAGALGGCIWPPRSYSCNFCNREFRSAQALGGHMNVHRRDRARLKQSLSPINIEALHHHNHSSPTIVESGNLSLNSRVSGLSIPDNLSENDTTFASAYSSSCSETVGVRLMRISESKVPQGEKTPREDHHSISCLGYDDDDDYVETDLAVGMNSFVSQNRPTGSCCKRPKTAVSSLSIFLKACSDDTYNLHESPEVIGILKPNSIMEDLDLELRLGDPPKVK